MDGLAEAVPARPDGQHKRGERLYVEARLQVRRHKRKKVPTVERQPLVRSEAANEVWSMDFVFDRSAEGRGIKCLTVVDDATHESVTIVPERAIGGQQVARILEHLAASRGNVGANWRKSHEWCRLLAP